MGVAERRLATDPDAAEPGDRPSLDGKHERRKVGAVIDNDLPLADLRERETLFAKSGPVSERPAAMMSWAMTGSPGWIGNARRSAGASSPAASSPGSSTEWNRYWTPGSASSVTRRTCPSSAMTGSTAAS
jgi:hypothetical protein